MLLFFKKHKTNDNPKRCAFTTSLLFSYILMLLPQLLKGSGDLKIVIYAGCFLTAVLLIINALLKHKIAFSRARLTLLICYAVTISLPVLYDVMAGIDVAFNDLIDVFVRIVSAILFFLLIPSDVKLEDLKGLFIGITIITFFASVYNVAINYTDMLSLAKITSSYDLNMMSFFSNRNTFALYLFAGIFSNLILLEIDDKKKKKYWIFTLLFNIVNLIFTMSRGGLLAVLILLAPSVYKFFMRHRLIALISVFVLIMACIYVVKNPSIQDTFMRLFVRSDVGTSGRGRLWGIGIDLLNNNSIITGVGYYTALGYTELSQFHSLFIDTLVDGGILGLITKISIFCYALFAIRNAAIEKSVKNIYMRGFLAVLFLSIFESVNIFALGSTEMLFTILFISIPLTMRGQYGLNESNNGSVASCKSAQNGAREVYA